MHYGRNHSTQARSLSCHRRSHRHHRHRSRRRSRHSRLYTLTEYNIGTWNTLADIIKQVHILAIQC